MKAIRRTDFNMGKNETNERLSNVHTFYAVFRRLTVNIS